MKCVFFEDTHCLADYVVRGVGWKVDDNVKNKYCVTEEFPECPRFKAKLQIIASEKPSPHR